MNRNSCAGWSVLAGLVLAITPAFAQEGDAASGTTRGGAAYSLVFDPAAYVVETTRAEGQTIRYRAFEGIVYVSNPVDVTYEKLNFFVPEAYYEGESIGGYTVDSAPIFFPNAAGGYLPAEPSGPESRWPALLSSFPVAGHGGAAVPLVDAVSGASPAVPGGFGTGPGPNAIFVALSKGYVVASPGCRGGITDGDGLYSAKAPACVVDLKAAVRYLRHNDAAMPGDAEKIISSGEGPGGVLAALVGVTGNDKEYEPYLAAIGAAEARDEVFAASCCCSIIDLEYLDMAYGRKFGGTDVYETTAARYWRIRHGADDREEELFAWIARICG